MFDQMQQMMASPQAREKVFKMLAQQIAQAPPEKKAALARIKATLEKTLRGMSLEVGASDDPQIETMINEAIENWTEMLSRVFQSMGFQVEIIE